MLNAGWSFLSIETIEIIILKVIINLVHISLKLEKIDFFMCLKKIDLTDIYLLTEDKHTNILFLSYEKNHIKMNIEVRV